MAREEKITNSAKPLVVHLFDHQEVLAELLRVKGIHKGRWQLVFELAHIATNVDALMPGASVTSKVPAGMVLIGRIGIAPSSEVNNLTLDAAEANPGKSSRKKSRSTHRAKK